MKKKWSLFVIIYFASLIVVFNQYKVPPVMSELMQTFALSATETDWFMSVFALTGILLSLPTAVFLHRIGAKGIGTLGLACTVLGCFIGSMAVSSATLISGRVIESLGLTILAVVAPTVIATSFPPEEMGLPMGIWATWYPVGSALAYNLSQPITAIFGSWQGNWWVGAIAATVAMIMYFLAVGTPRQDEARQTTMAPRHSVRTAPPEAFTELKNIKIWLLGASFLFMMIGSLGYLTWAPTYFVNMFGFAKNTANAYASMGFLWSAPGGIFAGWLLTRTSKQKALLIGCTLSSLAIYSIGFLIPMTILAYYLAALGFVTGFTCALVFAMVPMMMTNRAFTGIGMGIIAFMQNLANFVATPLFGMVTTGGIWSNAVLPSVVILSFSLFCAARLYEIA